MSELLDITEIASLLKLRREYVRDRLVKNPGFPEPAMTLSQRVRRWRREDVERWLSRQAQQPA
jgi:predicted DNA-binding transcriptional regulator AlpA